MLFMKKMNNKGFSLVELIIVIAIMAILAGAIAPALIRYIDKSRRSNDVSSCDTIETAVNTALGNETISEFLTAPASATAPVYIKFEAGKKTSSSDAAATGSKVKGIKVEGYDTAFESSSGKTAAEALDITLEELAASFGEKIPKIKYKKDAKTEDKCSDLNFYCVITPAGSVEVFIASDAKWKIADATQDKVVDQQGIYEICPEVCDSYQ